MQGEQSPRLPYVSEQPDDPEMAEVFARLRNQWRGAPVLHLYRLLGWAPGIVGPWLEFARALRSQTSLDPKLRELLVVRSGQLLGAEYEWKHHWVAALDVGIPEEKLRALSDWRACNVFDAEERAVLALADETAIDRGASEVTFGGLRSHFSNEEVAELVVIAGFYSGVARIVNSFAVPLEPEYESMTPRRT